MQQQSNQNNNSSSFLQEDNTQKQSQQNDRKNFSKYIQKNNSKYSNYQITINNFVANSRLIKSLPSSVYTIKQAQMLDICLCSSKSSVKIGIIFLTMQYYMKFPRYLENKLKEICQKRKVEKGNRANRQFDDGKLYVLVLIEQQNTKNGEIGELDRFSSVQMTIIKFSKQNSGLIGQIKLIPCFGVDDARSKLFELSSEYTNHQNRKQEQQ